MKTLYIDTHYIDIHILLYEDGNIIKKEDIINVKNNSELIMPTINKVCQPNDIDEIIVVNGPGSFTGVRLGVTIAKTLAYTLKKDIKTITYFDVLYASNNYTNGLYAISDNNGYFVNEYKDGKSLNNYKYISKIDFNEFSNNNIFMNIEIDYLKVYNYAKKQPSQNPHIVNPLYIKLIGVEK